MNKKILIIDDEKGIQEMFRFMLEPEGFKVFTADNGVEGVELAKKDVFDVIFLDVHMPKMRGPEALKLIKKINPEQVVIIFSSSSDPNYVFENRARDLGAYCCLYKPANIDEILKVMAEAGV